MIETFSAEQHQHYRAQLQAIQVDMTLILRANPYNNVPLDDDAEDIEHEIEIITGGNLPHITNEAAKIDYHALAGKRYHDYVQDINRAMEQRDADLTALKVRLDFLSFVFIVVDQLHGFIEPYDAINSGSGKAVSDALSSKTCLDSIAKRKNKQYYYVKHHSRSKKNEMHTMTILIPV